MANTTPERIRYNQFLILKSFETSVFSIVFVLLLSFFILSKVHYKLTDSRIETPAETIEFVCS
jgi:fumarate reductase subunit D